LFVWLRNGGEDDEVAAVAASGVEEVRGEAGRQEAGGGRSGAGGRRKGGVDGGDQVEGPEAGAELAEEDGCEKKLHKGGGGGGRGPPRRRRRGVGRGVSDPLYSLRLQGQCVSPLGGRFHCLQCESLCVCVLSSSFYWVSFVGLCDFDYYKHKFVGFYVFKDYRNFMGLDGFFFFFVSNLVGFLFGLTVFDLRA
jgi:hypothetical protein